jgi:cytochrome c biogenesis protein CcdA/thiol-disulfide isomerase/thioredoxin
MTASILDVGQAFFEGVALIASPCILPVLPLVLSASVDGGRKRPFGIIIGFVVMFSLFTFLTRKIVTALGIDPQLIRDASLVLLTVFGLILLSGKLSEHFSRMTQGAASLGNRAADIQKDGLFSGILIGMLIALVWTPCAGPILAAVLVQVIRQQSDFAGLVLIGAFSFGAGLPMLFIALLGRRAMKNMGFLVRHTEAIRKAMGVVILLAVAFIASGIDPQSLFANDDAPVRTASVNGLENGLPKPYRAPEFAGLTQWINSKPLTMAGLKGKVVLVDFWTYSCINCVRTLPYLTSWDKKYRGKGLVIVGISAPEFEFEKNADNVRAAMKKNGIEYPVALDNNLETWGVFDNHYWPAHYLIDRDGNVVYTHFGEGEYARTENNIRFLLGLKPGDVTVQKNAETAGAGQTPETYLGYGRMADYAGEPPVVPSLDDSYTLPKFLPADNWALGGRWKVEKDKIVSLAKGSRIQLNFTAGKVYLVLGTADGKPVHARLMLNGAPAGPNAGKDAPGGMVTVDRNTLYQLIDQKAQKNALLDITADRAGLEAYAFTFGQ